MKNVFLLFALSIVVSNILGQNAWSQEDFNSLEQVQLPAPSVVESPGTTVIQISDKVSYSIESTPNLENMKKAMGLIIPANVIERILLKGGTIPPETNPLEGFEGLSPEKKEQFHKTRLLFLQNVARALNATKFVFGMGSIIGNSLSFIKEAVINVVKKNKSSEKQTIKDKLSFKESSRAAVESTLQALDYKLWNQAPLLLDSNEFGVSASLGIMVENGILNNGVGGSEELGLSFAYNKTSKAFVFEIFHNSEKYSYTPAVVTIAGVLLKMGPQFGQKDMERPTKTIHGTSFYPPAMPGYSATGPDYFSAGFSSSLGFPPNPIVDMLTYTNKYSRTSLFRVTVSPFVKGYVRFYFGNVAGSVKLVIFRFTGVFQWISQRIIQVLRSGRGCETVFTSAKTA